MANVKVGLHVMSSRGLAVLTALLDEFGADAIGYVVTSADPNIQNDYRAEIVSAAERAGVRLWDRGETPTTLPAVQARFAIAWRWMLPVEQAKPLVVFHDSLLPRYRGFAPLISSLINAEPLLGVTALLGTADYDTGPVLGQEQVAVRYPLRIREALEAVQPCYAKLAVRVLRDLAAEAWAPRAQDATQATYSLWRDEADYTIDWTWDAAAIRRFVDATGYPYRGAATFAGTRRLRVLAATEQADVRIENRAPGKIIFVEEGKPIVVCGRGLLRIDELVEDGTAASVLPWTRFRTRFTTHAAEITV